MRLASLAAALLFAAPVWAQTTIYQQSFEDGDPSFTSSITCNDGDDDFFTRTDGSDIAASYEVTGVDGAFFFAAQDMDAAECAGTGNLPQRISFDDIDISGFENLSARPPRVLCHACVKYMEETHPQPRICMACGLAI